MKIILSSLFFLTLLIAGCNSKQGALFYGSILANQDVIVISNNVASNRKVTMYDMNGNFLGLIRDYTDVGQQPMGVTAISPFEIIVAIETNETLDVVNPYDQSKNTWFVDPTNFTGNLFQARAGPDNSVYVIETNTIERISANGRIPATGTAYIATTITTGAQTCTLTTPRGIAFTAAGYLVSVETGAANDRVNLYNVSGASSATCQLSATPFGNANGVAVLGHSNGNIYVGTIASEVIYSVNPSTLAATSIYSAASIITDPTAMVEHESGDLLIASDGTDQVVRITTSGTLVDAAFIKTGDVTAVTDMFVIKGK